MFLEGVHLGPSYGSDTIRGKEQPEVDLKLRILRGQEQASCNTKVITTVTNPEAGPIVRGSAKQEST